jgi:two-component system phosphate regulon sensor histidine kinase PhoR
MNSTRKIGLILILVFLLPALFYSVYQLSSLGKDERMIEDIYSKQLETILFSVNQYSDDVVSTWTSKIEIALAQPPSTDSIPPKIADLLNINSPLKAIFTIDSSQTPASLKTYSFEQSKNIQLWKKTKEALGANSQTIAQLVSFKKSGFQKIEKLKVDLDSSELHCLIFITQPSAKKFQITGLYIDANIFIEDVVGPRLQSIPKDQFALVAILKKSDSVVYDNNISNNANAGTRAANSIRSDFWIFPDYELGIKTKGETLQKLIHDRTTLNIYLLVALDLILVLAVYLVFKNLKKEVNLAQNKADFVSNVSHEIRTPLALISMFAETLEMGRVASEEKRNEYYRIISKETQRLTGIVNKILNFSQTEAKRKTLHIEKLNLGTEVKAILNTYDFHLSNKGFTYTFTSFDDLWIKADKEALVESVINLIDNAVKYSTDIKKIEISSGIDGDFVFLAVKDFGVGINKEHQKHIFDKFYRVPSGNLARSRGTGLGLSLVKQLMDAQKGKITVNSKPGEESTFTLYFPV